MKSLQVITGQTHRRFMTGRIPNDILLRLPCTTVSMYIFIGVSWTVS